LKLLFIVLVYTSSLLSFEYTIQPEKVSSDTYCFFGLPEVMDEHNNGNMSNSCFVNMGTSYLVIDSGPTYLHAKQAHAKMKKIKDLPISYIINTHNHDDHILGNSYYSELGIDIIGSHNFKNEIKVQETRMQTKILEVAYKGTSLVFPSLLVEDEKVFKVDNKEVHVQSVNKKAHSSCDLLVYIPKYSTLFVGDLVFNGMIPSIRDGNLKQWIEALDKARSVDAKYIVGGHGSIVDKTSSDMTYKYITELTQKVSSLIKDGEEIGDVVNLVKMESFIDIKLYDAMHRQNVEAAYRMLEWGDE